MKREQPSDAMLRNRPNKTARGMTITAYRSGHNQRWTSQSWLDSNKRGNSEYGHDALTLSVHGTLDVLARCKFNRKRRTVTYYGLNEKGKQKLARMRATKAQQVA